jgi:hypothetical protein
MNKKTHSLRNGVFCALIFLACFWVAWPVAQMGFVDDWSYIKVAQVFARTGHIVYNGWPVEILGWMVPWGALFIKLFGFSFMTVKLSTLPVAVATLLLFHSILRRFAITPRNAVIGTLTLGLSPLFLPLSASFMTDIPGLFVIVLCLYCCRRAVEAGSDRAAIAWLLLAATTNVVGGTARQIAWLGVLVMVPCTGWLLRKRQKVLVTAVGLWLAGIGVVLYCMHWFAEQPYSIQTPIFPQISGSVRSVLHQFLSAADSMGALLLCLLLFLFPVLVAWLPRFGRKLHHYLALMVVGLLPMLAVVLVLKRYAEIWPPHVLFKELAMKKEVTMGWEMDLKHSLIPMPAQIVLSLVFIAAALGMIFTIRDKGWEPIRAKEAHRGRQLFWLLVPVSISYCVLLLPMVLQGESFDRYVLDLMPLAIIGCIWLYQQYIGPELPVSTVAILAIYGIIAVAGTHDWFAWQRARLVAIHELRVAGVARTEIQGGFEYDGWTQLRNGGYINDPRIKNPQNAYHPVLEKLKVPDGCRHGYTAAYPVLHPKYAVGFGPGWCYLPSRFPAVHYTAWLPTFRRTIEIQKVPTGQVKR